MKEETSGGREAFPEVQRIRQRMTQGRKVDPKSLASKGCSFAPRAEYKYKDLSKLNVMRIEKVDDEMAKKLWVTLQSTSSGGVKVTITFSQGGKKAANQRTLRRFDITQEQLSDMKRATAESGAMDFENGLLSCPNQQKMYELLQKIQTGT